MIAATGVDRSDRLFAAQQLPYYTEIHTLMHRPKAAIYRLMKICWELLTQEIRREPSCVAKFN
jgi:hypothetical protein